MTLRVVQISDTHLSGRKPLFQANFDTLCAWLHADPPDLIVCSGDLSLDGADSEEDLRFAAEQLARLPARCLAIPGNHDVGDFAELATSQVISAERLARWHAVMGADHFVHEVPGWRLIGLNTQSLGSGLAEEAAQAEALQEAERVARARAAEAGAAPDSLVLVDVEDLPIAYLPGGALRVRARVVGEIASD
jgi:3',5'-cyclic AMP phosphodiesterase CpdA